MNKQENQMVYTLKDPITEYGFDDPINYLEVKVVGRKGHFAINKMYSHMKGVRLQGSIKFGKALKEQDELGMMPTRENEDSAQDFDKKDVEVTQDLSDKEQYQEKLEELATKKKKEELKAKGKTLAKEEEVDPEREEAKNVLLMLKEIGTYYECYEYIFTEMFNSSLLFALKAGHSVNINKNIYDNLSDRDVEALCDEFIISFLWKKRE